MLDSATQQEASPQAASTPAADIVLGLLRYESAGSGVDRTREAHRELTSRFPPEWRSVIVLANGGLSDGRQELPDDVVQIGYTIHPAQKISPEHYGVPGKSNGVQAIFGIAAELNARACAIVDLTIAIPSLSSMETLVRPVIDEAIDLVAPRYTRNKYDGAILNGIIYPLTRALYGKRIHQPIGGDFAVSGKLVNYLAKQSWPDGNSTSSETDAWLTVRAISGGFRLAEGWLGPRELVRHEPAPEASAVLSQALGSVLAEMNRSAAYWQRIRSSQMVPAFGPGFEALAEPAPVDPISMVQSFRLGYQNLQDIYRLVLPPATLMELKRMCLYSPDSFHFDDAVWTRVIYDFALAWRMRTIDRDHLMGALTPLYLGWVASWVRTVRDAGPEAVDDRIETLCMAYETQKNYLISRWRWPDRFSP